MHYQDFCRPKCCRIKCIDEVKYKIYEKKCIIIVKECPRCGCECEAMAPACPSCGYARQEFMGMMPMGEMHMMGRMD